MKTCTQCGQSFDDTYAACPICGAPFQQEKTQKPGTVKPLVLGIAGLTCAVVALILLLVGAAFYFLMGAGFAGGFFAIIYGAIALSFAIPGIICSILGRRSALRYEEEGGAPSGKVRTGKRLAAVGLWLSAAGLALAAALTTAGIVSCVNGDPNEVPKHLNEREIEELFDWFD